MAFSSVRFGFSEAYHVGPAQTLCALAFGLVPFLAPPLLAGCAAEADEQPGAVFPQGAPGSAAASPIGTDGTPSNALAPATDDRGLPEGRSEAPPAQGSFSDATDPGDPSPPGGDALVVVKTGLGFAVKLQPVSRDTD